MQHGIKPSRVGRRQAFVLAGNANNFLPKLAMLFMVVRIDQSIRNQWREYSCYCAEWVYFRVLSIGGRSNKAQRTVDAFFVRRPTDMRCKIGKCRKSLGHRVSDGFFPIRECLNAWEARNESIDCTGKLCFIGQIWCFRKRHDINREKSFVQTAI